MPILRITSTLARLVLAWFVLTLGIATASPVISPMTMEAVCSVDATMKLVVVDENGDLIEASQHTLDCAMCLPVSLLSSGASRQTKQPQPLAFALTPIEGARIAALVGAPLPPRGPPSRA